MPAPMVETEKAASTAEAPTEISLDDALAIAVSMHSEGKLDDAETIYRRILEVVPDHPDALNFLGMIAMTRGRRAEAVELIRQSLEADPTVGERYVNLGNVLLATGRVDEALEAFERAAAMAPDSSKAHCNLGVVYGIQRRFDEAKRVYERAIELDPMNAEAHHNYGNLLGDIGDIQGSLKSHGKAIELRPSDPNSRRQVGAIYTAIGEIDKAAQTYRDWLAHEPDSPLAQHLLAACLGGKNVPDRASDAFIRHGFDTFALTFDAKLANLGYKAPELVEAALRRRGIPADKSLVLLDAGCGTGLCGPLVAKYALRLEGVDLSGGMLEQARSRGIYDALAEEELTQFLTARHHAYDVVLSADTLCYFGPLDAVMRAAAGALRPGGWLVFTVERADDAEAPQGHRINPHGRYSHTSAYIEKTLAESGFEPCELVEDVLRQEAGSPVRGLVVTARKAGRNPVE
jgi:predicted TPR repeat methyltransferase